MSRKRISSRNRKGYAKQPGAPYVVASLLLALLILSSQPLGSETLNLVTTYPSPVGIYKTIITTNQAILARDGGSVGIGSFPTPGFELTVVGMAAFNNPGTFGQISVQGDGNGSQYAAVNLSGPPAASTWGIQYRQDSGNLTFGFYPSGAPQLQMTQNSRIGIGITTPQPLWT